MKWTLPLLCASLLLFSLSNCGDDPYKQGRILYNNYCANCHIEDGSGLAVLIPPLAKADYLRDNQELLPCMIRYGMQGPIVVNDTLYNQAMPGAEELTSFEIANIINYINHAWGNDYGYFPHGRVTEALEACE